MTRKLIIDDGRHQREVLLLGTIVVGRDPSCHVSDLDPLLSRRHAEFTCGPQGVAVKDLGSRNGILVNGEKVTERRLGVGDIVQLGHLHVSYVEVAAPSTPDEHVRAHATTATAMDAATMAVPARPNAALEDTKPHPQHAHAAVDPDATRVAPPRSMPVSSDLDATTAPTRAFDPDATMAPAAVARPSADLDATMAPAALARTAADPDATMAPAALARAAADPDATMAPAGLSRDLDATMAPAKVARAVDETAAALALARDMDATMAPAGRATLRYAPSEPSGAPKAPTPPPAPAPTDGDATFAPGSFNLADLEGAGRPAGLDPDATFVPRRSSTAPVPSATARLTAGADHRVQSASPSCQVLLGAAPDTFVGRPLEHVLAYMLRAIESPQKPPQWSVTVERGSDRTLTLTITATQAPGTLS